MKKKSIICLLVSFGILFPILLQAQTITSFGSYFNFEFIGDFNGVRAAQVERIPDNSLYQLMDGLVNKPEGKKAKSSILLGVKLNPERANVLPVPVQYLSRLYSSYYISDSSEATIIAMGINERNIDSFRYRVVENDSTEIIPWSRIPGLEQNYGAKEPYGLIGRFTSPGRQLFVEVRHVHNYSIRDGIVFDWRIASKPKLQQVAIFFRKDRKTVYSNLKNERSFAKGFDPETNIPKEFRFHQNTISNIQLFFDDHYDIPYSASIRRVSDQNAETYYVDADFTDRSFQIHQQHFDRPGKYEIVINRSGGFGALAHDKALIFPFEVLRAPFSMHSLTVEMVIIVVFILLVAGGFMFAIYYRRNNRKLKSSAQERELASLKLNSLRSQLNPHFMFNALSSIQNLINQHRIEEANYYLSKFSTLTRQVLDSSNDEQISLRDEISLLNTYLEMEQLRFCFQFHVKADQELDLANIEIPTMLLQPLVENAVKHGVSALKESGIISVVIQADHQDLLLTISDNGKGFKKSNSEGYGLKLSDERISLLNHLYKGQAITLIIEPTTSGTNAIIRLANWIA